MSIKKYLEDFKNLKPRPLERIWEGRIGKVGSQQLPAGSEVGKQRSEVGSRRTEGESSLQSTVGSEVRNQRSEAGIRRTEGESSKLSTVDLNTNELKEIKNMERLNNSKTLWGFGIAVFIYILQNILNALNIASPDNLIVKAIIETVIAIAGLFGVYGIRDALRKMSL